MWFVLFLLVACVSGHKDHKCIHDQIVRAAAEPELVAQEHVYPKHSIKRANADDILTQPLRILANIDNMEDDPETCYKVGDPCKYSDDGTPCVCREVDVIDTEKRELVVKLMSEVHYHFRNLLLVLPRKNDVLNIKTSLESAKSCDVMIPVSYSDGIVGYDYVLFVTTRPVSSDTTLAFARSCQIELLNNLIPGRPIVGIININPASLDTSKAAYRGQLGILIHEATHALGFTIGRFESGFVKWDDVNQKWTRVTKVLDSYYHPAIGHTVTRIITPEVQAAAAKHFNCPGLDGGELEDGGEPQTRGSHWEKRVYENEYMVGISSAYPVYSEITAALFKDMGWYAVKDTGNILSPLIWGKDMGCSFCNDSCKTWPLNSEKEGYLCENQPNDACTFDMRGWGHCNSNYDNPLVVEPGCYFYQAYTNTYCEYDTKYVDVSIPAGEKHSASSRCFHSSLSALPGSLTSYTRFPQAPYMQCYPTQCTSAKELKVAVEDVWYDCPYEGGYVYPIGFGGSIECKAGAADIVCVNATDFDPIGNWPIFTSVYPLSGAPSTAENRTLITIYGANFWKVSEVWIGGALCNNFTLIDENELTVTLPLQEAYNSFTALGALSARVSIVLRDKQGRTAAGKDMFMLELTVNGRDVASFFNRLGLSKTSFTAMTITVIILGGFSCCLYAFFKYRRQQAVENLTYKPAKLDKLVKNQSSSSSSSSSSS